MNLVVLGQTMWALVGLQNWVSWAHRLGMGVRDRLQTSRTRTWVTVPKFIAVDQTVGVYVRRNPPEKLGSSCPAFQGHSKSSEVTLFLFHSYHGTILYRFQIIARYWPKLANFSYPIPIYRFAKGQFDLERPNSLFTEHMKQECQL